MNTIDIARSHLQTAYDMALVNKELAKQIERINIKLDIAADDLDDIIM